MNIIATSAAPKLSKTSKMPAKSWSLQAGTTCPGSINDPACEGCYAKKRAYTWAPAINARAHNKADWQKADWVEAMVKAIGKPKSSKFRWFDSGDCYALPLARKILEVMKATPHVNHWLPTRMGRFAKFSPILAEMAALPNVVVRHSAIGYDNIDNTTANNSMIFTDSIPEGVTACPATTAPKGDPQRGKCGECDHCWNKEVQTVGYHYHA